MTNIKEIIDGLDAKAFKEAQVAMRNRVKDEAFKAELELLKGEAKEQSKEEKATEKAIKSEAGKKVVSAAGVGGKVKVWYGKEEIEVTVRTLDLSKNTFGIKIEGNPSEKLWRYFHQVC